MAEDAIGEKGTPEQGRRRAPAGAKGGARAENLPVEDAPSIDRAASPPVISSEPSSPIPRLLSPLEDEVQRTLPSGVEAHRVIKYRINLHQPSSQETRARSSQCTLVIVDLSGAPDKDEKLREWGSAFEKSHPGVTLITYRSRGSVELRSQLCSHFARRRLLDDRDIPTLLQTLRSFRGDPPMITPRARARQPARRDLTSIPFVGLDPPTTNDAEDLLHASIEPDGTYVLSIAFVDITDYIAPGRDLDLYSLRVGNTFYGRTLNIHPLPPLLATSLCAFKLQMVRPAWVVRITFSPESVGIPEDVQLLRAFVKNHAQIDPSGALRMPRDPAIDASCVALAHLSNLLQRRRASETLFTRIDGEGTGHQVLSEAMVLGKHLIFRHLRDAKMGALYRVQGKADTAFIAGRVKDLRKLGVQCDENSLHRAAEFAAILRELQLRRSAEARIVLTSLLDRFLLRTQLSTEPSEHAGIGVDVYGEIKPRDASGITNALQLDALWNGTEPFTDQVLRERSDKLNTKRLERPAAYYKFLFLESLAVRLNDVGSGYFAAVVEAKRNVLRIQVPGFSRWGIVLNPPKRGYEKGEAVMVTYAGFNLHHMRDQFFVERG